MQVDIDEVIKALNHPVRRDILHWLKDPQAYFADQGPSLENGVCAGKIDQHTGLSQSTVSAHLATLQRAGLIRSKKVGHRLRPRRGHRRSIHGPSHGQLAA